MSISINQFKTGLTVLIDDKVYMIVSYEHVKPGKGAAFCRTKLRDLKTGQLIERTFRDGDRLQEAFVEEKKLQFLYREGQDYHFMDMQDFNEFTLSKDVIGEFTDFLKDNLELTGYFYKGQLINIKLPQFIELKVVKTEPGFKGDSVKSGTKPAVLETGLEINVPLFIQEGDVIKVNTQTKEYVERV